MCSHNTPLCSINVSRHWGLVLGLELGPNDALFVPPVSIVNTAKVQWPAFLRCVQIPNPMGTCHVRIENPSPMGVKKIFRHSPPSCRSTSKQRRSVLSLLHSHFHLFHSRFLRIKHGCPCRICLRRCLHLRWQELRARLQGAEC